MIESDINKEDKEDDKALLEEYKAEVAQELKKYCDEVIGMLDNSLIKDSLDVEGSVFYLKMKADYYRYLAEFMEKDKNAEQSEAAYVQATKASTADPNDGMNACNPARLGVALNYSVFLYEMRDKQQDACRVAKEAFDQALEGLEQVEVDTDYKDATLIMQLLRDNLQLWTN